MATEAPKPEEGQQDGSKPEEGQEQQGQQQSTPPEEGGSGSSQDGQKQDDGKLPDDHPVVKALAKATAKSTSLATELAEARAQAAKATQLEEDLGKRPTTEAMDTLQKRYDRLEAFLGQVGGPLSKALDSRTFTRDLFETDKDIKDLVTEYQRANPTATSTALGAKGAAPAEGKVDPNTLLRAAFNGK